MGLMNTLSGLLPPSAAQPDWRLCTAVLCVQYSCTQLHCTAVHTAAAGSCSSRTDGRTMFYDIAGPTRRHCSHRPQYNTKRIGPATHYSQTEIQNIKRNNLPFYTLPQLAGGGVCLHWLDWHKTRWILYEQIVTIFTTVCHLCLSIRTQICFMHVLW